MTISSASTLTYGTNEDAGFGIHFEQFDLFENQAADQSRTSPNKGDTSLFHEDALAAINAAGLSRSEQMLSLIFLTRISSGVPAVPFTLDDLAMAAQKLGAKRPKNLPDVIYAVQQKDTLPDLITQTAPTGSEWQIEALGQGTYCLKLAPVFRVIADANIEPNVVRDKSCALACDFDLTEKGKLEVQLRINGLLDDYFGARLTLLCQPPRGMIKNAGQGEIDAIYTGTSPTGRPMVVPILLEPSSKPVPVKKPARMVHHIQQHYPNYPNYPFVVQRLEDGTIALIELAPDEEGIRVLREKHYRLI